MARPNGNSTKGGASRGGAAAYTGRPEDFVHRSPLYGRVKVSQVDTSEVWAAPYRAYEDSDEGASVLPLGWEIALDMSAAEATMSVMASVSRTTVYTGDATMTRLRNEGHAAKRRQPGRPASHSKALLRRRTITVNHPTVGRHTSIRMRSMIRESEAMAVCPDTEMTGRMAHQEATRDLSIERWGTCRMYDGARDTSSPRVGCESDGPAKVGRGNCIETEGLMTWPRQRLRDEGWTKRGEVTAHTKQMVFALSSVFPCSSVLTANASSKILRERAARKDDTLGTPRKGLSSSMRSCPASNGNLAIVQILCSRLRGEGRRAHPSHRRSQKTFKREPAEYSASRKEQRRLCVLETLVQDELRTGWCLWAGGGICLATVMATKSELIQAPTHPHVTGLGKSQQRGSDSELLVRTIMSIDP
ncbi:hypothetical protein R3P38DRAFT_2799631 [Favolaschia claudopus]|uniref:Uncharacterized protein n=1 Tax=Favolaschia claudopus TaxID=2862362 RepID=A0AAV9ZZS9_9AGAR